MGGNSVEVTLHGEIEDEHAKTLVATEGFVTLVLHVAALMLHRKGDQQRPTLKGLSVRAAGVSSVPWKPDRPAMLGHPSPLDSSNTFMYFYVTDCTDGSRGRRVAEQVYNVLRFLQTQDYGTGQKFLVLFSSSDGLPFEFKMLHFKDWRRTVSRDVVSDPLVDAHFNIERKYESFERPARIKSASHGIILFIAWDEDFFGRVRRDHLDKYIFKRHAMNIDWDQSFPLTSTQ